MNKKIRKSFTHNIMLVFLKKLWESLIEIGIGIEHVGMIVLSISIPIKTTQVNDILSINECGYPNRRHGKWVDRLIVAISGRSQ
jgi:hypothetical protein